MPIRTGGCACGAIRYECSDEMAAHIWTDSVQPWDCLHPGLPTFATTPSEEDLGTVMKG